MLQTAVLEYVEEVGQSARLLELTCFIHREAKVIISPSRRQVSILLLLMQHLTVSYAWPLRQQLLTTRSSGTPRMSVNKPLQLSKMSRKSHTSLHASLYKFVIITSLGTPVWGNGYTLNSSPCMWLRPFGHSVNDSALLHEPGRLTLHVTALGWCHPLLLKL